MYTKLLWQKNQLLWQKLKYSIFCHKKSTLDIYLIKHTHTCIPNFCGKKINFCGRKSSIHVFLPQKLIYCNKKSTLDIYLTSYHKSWVYMSMYVMWDNNSAPTQTHCLDQGPRLKIADSRVQTPHSSLPDACLFLTNRVANS